MTTSDCNKYRESLLRVLEQPENSVSDDVALHLDDCVSCGRVFDTNKLDLDPEALEELPAAVRARIMDGLAAARHPGARWWAPVAVAAAFAVLVSGLWLMAGADRSRIPGSSPLLAALVDDHVRYRHYPERQTAADPERLTRYLAAYVDFPVRLPLPADATFSGATRCRLLNRRAALAFYETAAGPASYFVLTDDGTGLAAPPCPGDPQLSCSTHGGYHVIHWHRAGLLHALVGEKQATLISLAHGCGAHAMEESS